MEQKLRTLRCLHCDREIQVPEELDIFSCVYCGEKLNLTDYLPAEPVCANEEDLLYAREHLFDCIRNYPNYFRNFSRKNYDASFQTYVCGIEDAFVAMDRYVCAKTARRDELIDGFVDLFLEQWEEFHHQGKAGRNKSAAERAMFNDKLTLAWYTMPAILSLELSTGPDFTERLQQRFCEKYPNNIFRVGSYADLSGGFRKRGLCFITTAVCEFEQKPDDCEELTAFRAFRDLWLAQTAEGRAMIEAYYEIAPPIVQAVDYCDDRAARYGEIRRDYLEPCYTALKEGQTERCRDLYLRMVDDLAERYGLESRTVH